MSPTSQQRPKKPNAEQRRHLIALIVEPEARITIRRYPENDPEHPNQIFFSKLFFKDSKSNVIKRYDLGSHVVQQMEEAGWIEPITERQYAKHVSYAKDRRDYTQSFGISEAGRIALGQPAAMGTPPTKENPATDA